MSVEIARPAKKRRLAAEERQRAVRACAECRRLKEKCEDGVPCKRCRHLQRPCEISILPAEKDRRASELANSSNDIVEQVRCMRYILRHHFPQLALDLDSLRRTCDSLNGPPVRHETTPGLPQQPEITEHPGRSRPTKGPIENEDCTIDMVDDTTIHYSGEFSHWNFSMQIKRNVEELMARANVPSLNHANQIPDFIRVGEADPTSTSISEIVAILPPRSVATFLVNAFFKHATSFYYFVDRAWLDDNLDRMYSTTTGLCSKDITSSCLVLMLLAIGTQYAHLDSMQKDRRRGAGISAHINTSTGWEFEVGAGFYRQVVKTVSEVIHSGSVLSVQVFLLLGLYYLPLDASGLAYIYLNLALKIAIQNGMHRKTSGSAFHTDQAEFRRRIWWTAYCMERKIGIYHGRPTSIVWSEIDAALPQNASADDFDSTGLLESIALLRQADVFLQDISHLRTCARSEAGTILDRIRLMKANLHGSWSPPSNGKSYISADETEEHTTTRAGMHSQLECCLLHMFIGRPFVLARRQDYRNSTASNSAEATWTKSADSHSQWDFLVQDCVAAAEEAIRICHRLQTGDLGLAKSSYTEYSSCRASLLVLIAYSICYRTNEFSRILRRGLDAIREMASVGDSARSEVNLIETLESALHRLHDFDTSSGRPGAPLADEPTTEGYEGFANWYTTLGATENSDAGPSVRDSTDDDRQRVQIHEFDCQPILNADLQATSGIPDDVSIESYPFDFDLLHMDANAAFTTANFNGLGAYDRGLLEDLFWMPR